MKHTYYSTRKIHDDSISEFISNAQISDTSQKDAINFLVGSLKTANIWDKMKAIYPMVGGTDFSHRFNLKDPRQSDEAYFLNFVGNVTHSSNGAKFNGSGYADTHLSPISVLTSGNLHVSFYSRTERNGQIELEMGSQNNTKDSSIFLIYGINGQSYEALGNTDDGVDTQIFSPTTGHLILSRTGTSSIKAWRGGDKRTLNFPASVLPTPTIFLGARNSNGVFGVYDLPSNKECAFASIGDGLTDDELNKFQEIVQEYQLILNRAILDTNAQNFITAANLSTINHKMAIEKLVTDLKAAGIYGKLKAAYPFIGGSANSHKYNLLDPRDTDDAFRLDFINGANHTIVGANGNGNNQYANTHIIPSQHLMDINSVHIGFYSGNDVSDSAGKYKVSMGSTSSNYGSGLYFYARGTSNNYWSHRCNTNQETTTVVNASTKGFIIASRNSANRSVMFLNEDIVNDFNYTTNYLDSSIISLFGLYRGGGEFSNADDKIFQYATIGYGLSDNEIIDYSKIVSNYQIRARYIEVDTNLDSDASIFINYADLTEAASKNAINKLVKSLKSNGLWNKFKILYPFAGTSYDSQKLNLINPTVFSLIENVNKPLYTANGISFNGNSNIGLDTGFNPSTISDYSSHIALYVTREDASTVQVDFGSGSSGHYFDLEPNIYGSAYYENPNGGMINAVVPTAEGFTLGTRTSLNDVALYKNGVMVNSATVAFQGYPNINSYLGDRGGEQNYPSRRDYGFASIGDGLNSSEIALLNQIVQDYQADLGRKK